MEKLETRTCTREEAIHHFYCDDCHKYLGKTHEYDDGWYPDLGEFELKFFVNGDWYEINKCFVTNVKRNS